jgi:hypothetical protein
MSAFGTKRTSSDVQLKSVIGRNAENICSKRVFRLLSDSDMGLIGLFVPTDVVPS